MTYEQQAMSYELITDNGGRRTGMSRRRFSYADHIPERRSGLDRRCGSDRRCGRDRRRLQDRRENSRGSDKVVQLLNGRERRTPSDRRRVHERRITFA